MGYSHIKIVLQTLYGSRTPPEDGLKEAFGRVGLQGSYPGSIHVGDNTTQQQHCPTPSLIDRVQAGIVR